MDDRSQSAREWTYVILAIACSVLVGAIFVFFVDGTYSSAFVMLFVAILLAAVALAVPRVTKELATAWGEHRSYVAFATGLFAVGIAVGVALLYAGYDLLELISDLLGDDPFPDVDEADITAWFFISNNTVPFVASIAGAITLGLFTAWIMLFNGIIVGNLGAAVSSDVGITYIFVAIVPHGIFELPALFIAAGVGFRLLHRFAQRVRGTRESFVTRAYLTRTIVLVAFGWLLLVIAAFVEAYVTFTLVETLFDGGGLLESASDSTANALSAAIAVYPV